MDIMNPLEFSGPEQWRGWLVKNHSVAKEAWLVIYKKNSGKTGINYAQALEEALCFGWIDGRMKSLDNEKFALRYSPREKGSVWSKPNKDAAERLINEGKMTEAGLKSIQEAKKSGAWGRV